MIPIPKRGKDRKKASGYRPISLTSVVGKTMESNVNQRMKLYLETNQLLTHQQAGFRKFRSTEDQTAYLALEIEDVFQDKKVTLSLGSIFKERSTRSGRTVCLCSYREMAYQGGILSPTLFLLFINDLDLPRGVNAALYADDLVLWYFEEFA